MRNKVLCTWTGKLLTLYSQKLGENTDCQDIRSRRDFQPLPETIGRESEPQKKYIYILFLLFPEVFP